MRLKASEIEAGATILYRTNPTLPLAPVMVARATTPSVGSRRLEFVEGAELSYIQVGESARLEVVTSGNVDLVEALSTSATVIHLGHDRPPLEIGRLADCVDIVCVANRNALTKAGVSL